MFVINLILSFLLFINYHLALTYIGVVRNFKDTLLPASLLAIIAFVSKIIFIAPPVLHTIILVLICAIVLHFLNGIDFLLSIIGSLLTFMTLTFGSLLIACPLAVYMGFNLPTQRQISGFQWTFLTVAEFFVPTVVLIILKIKNFSIVKYMK